MPTAVSDSKSSWSFLPALDQAVMVCGEAALAGAILHKSVPLTKPFLSARTVSLLSNNRLLGFSRKLGLVAMAWNAAGAIHRLASRKSEETTSDLLTLGGALLAGAAVATSGTLRPWSALVQCGIVLGGVLLDTVNIAHLLKLRRDRPQDVTVGDIAIQSALAIVFNVDRQTLQAARGLQCAMQSIFSPQAVALSSGHTVFMSDSGEPGGGERRRVSRTPEEVAADILSAIQASSGKALVLSDPLLLGAVLMRSADFPAGFTFRLVEARRNRLADTPDFYLCKMLTAAEESAVNEAAVRIPYRVREQVRHQEWAKLLSCLWPGGAINGSFNAANQMLAGAQRMLPLASKGALDAAIEAEQRFGVELELYPPREEGGSVMPGWDRPETLSALREYLDEPRKGWGYQVAMLDVPKMRVTGDLMVSPLQMGPNCQVFPRRKVSFTLDVGGESTAVSIDFQQGTAGPIFFARMGGNLVRVDLKEDVLGTKFTDDPDRIYEAMRKALQQTCNKIARILGVPFQVVHDVATGPAATVYEGWVVKDASPERRLIYFTYTGGERGVVTGRNAQFMQGFKPGFKPESRCQLGSRSFTEAMRLFADGLQNNKWTLINTDDNDGLIVRVGDEERRVVLKYDHHDIYEVVFSPMKAQPDDLLLLERVLKFFEERGARGATDFNPVSCQVHVEIPLYDVSGKIVSPDPLVRWMERYYADEAQIFEAIPAGPQRKIFFKDPRDGFGMDVAQRKLRRGGDEPLDDWLLRVASEIIGSTEKHYSPANFDNIVHSLLDEAIKTKQITQEKYDAALARHREKVVEKLMAHKEKPLSRPDAEKEAAKIVFMRSGRSEPIPTVELRRLDTLTRRTPGGFVVDSESLSWYARFWAAFTHNALTADPPTLP